MNNSKNKNKHKAGYNQHIGLYDDLNLDLFCDEVIELFEKSKRVKTREEFQHEDGRSIPKTVMSDSATDVYNLDLEFNKNGNLMSTLSNVLDVCLDSYMKKYGLYGMNIGDVVSKGSNVQKTNPTEGYHLWHYEHNYQDPDRIAVYTLYLNDVKQGGETEFLFQSLRVPPKKGLVSIFPASYTHIHRGNPPLMGSKYIVTGWFCVQNPSNKELKTEDNVS